MVLFVFPRQSTGLRQSFALLCVWLGRTSWLLLLSISSRSLRRRVSSTRYRCVLLVSLKTSGVHGWRLEVPNESQLPWGFPRGCRKPLVVDLWLFFCLGCGCVSGCSTFAWSCCRSVARTRDPLLALLSLFLVLVAVISSAMVFYLGLPGDPFLYVVWFVLLAEGLRIGLEVFRLLPTVPLWVVHERCPNMFRFLICCYDCNCPSIQLVPWPWAPPLVVHRVRPSAAARGGSNH